MDKEVAHSHHYFHDYFGCWSYWLLVTSSMAGDIRHFENSRFSGLCVWHPARLLSMIVV